MSNVNTAAERHIANRVFEVRAANEGAKSCGTIVGYAALYDTEADGLGWYTEKIERGAFADVMQDDVRCLLNHDANCVMGRTSAGTLRLSEDETGLRYECDLPDTEAGRSLLASIERGDISQSSFQFRIANGGARWEEVETEPGTMKSVRTITKIGKMYDVAPVTFPAYSQTDVAKRSYEDWKEQTKPTIPAEMQALLNEHELRSLTLAV
jgi:uncharacterized protein